MRYLVFIRNIKNWWLYLLSKFGLTDRYPLFFKTRKGIIAEVPRGLLHTFKEIFMDECYMHGPTHMIPPCPVIIDIGANAGYFSLYAASRFTGARIFAYEPMPPNFKQLTRNINMNKNCKITAFQKAVAYYSGETVMIFDNSEHFPTTAQMLIYESKLDNKNNRLTVQCVTIKDIFDENKLDICDFLKIDSEGAEHKIIFNCPMEYLHRIKQFAIEVHGDTKPLIDYLNSKGFVTYETKKALGMLYAWKV
jgi:FkbM family methyltransferase